VPAVVLAEVYAPRVAADRRAAAGLGRGAPGGASGSLMSGFGHRSFSAGPRASR